MTTRHHDYTQEELEEMERTMLLEMRAEAMADWVYGGGDPADASTYAYHLVGPAPKAPEPEPFVDKPDTPETEHWF